MPHHECVYVVFGRLVWWTSALAAPVLAALLVACDLSPQSGSQQTGPKGPPPTATVPARPPASNPPQSPTAARPLPRLKLERVAPGISLQRPTGLYVAPDSNSTFYALEQAGRIRVVDLRPGANDAPVWLDITAKVDSSGNEMGLLGLAFGPDFGQSGVFYLDYTARNPLRTVISRFRADQSRVTANPATEEVLLEVPQPFRNHKGGQIAFGPDGFLYIGLGDGGSANDPMGNGQNRNVLLGKILRIDVSGAGGYRVPADNPFAGQAGARDEVWAYGLRNPWRFSFDNQTGDLWTGDVGQNAREEIDLVTKGGNYGWNTMEGNICRPGGSANCGHTGLIPPVIDYPTASGNCSVIGGFVYRGRTIPALVGAYIYGDFCSGRIWAIRYEGFRVTEQAELLDSAIQISSFGVDAQGEIYALDLSGGGIYRLAQ